MYVEFNCTVANKPILILSYLNPPLHIFQDIWDYAEISGVIDII